MKLPALMSAAPDPTVRRPSRMTLRGPTGKTGQRWLAAVIIGILSTLAAYTWRHTPVARVPLDKLEDLIYDLLWKVRMPEDRTGGPVVIVEIDQQSLELAAGALLLKPVYWSWPRELYGDMVAYLQEAGAKVVAFDMTFESPHNTGGTDALFADALAEAKIPVVLGTMVKPDGIPGPLGVPVKEPIFGAVNKEHGVLRDFRPTVNGYPSLAYRVATLYAGKPPERLETYRTRFYGPRIQPSGKTTYQHVSAYNLLAAVFADPSQAGLAPDVFRDKIVLIGGTAQGLYDDKSAPVDDIYPGVEWQATNVDNLLRDERVELVHPVAAIGTTLAACVLAAAGSILPRRVIAKESGAILAGAAVVALSVALFRDETIRWLPLAAPTVAIVFATVSGFAWSYFTEDRQRKVMLKYLGQSVSPTVAEQIDRDAVLRLDGTRREMTVIFTDVAGFTDLSEKIEPERLAKLMNFYLEEMSGKVLDTGGYLDKFIGDAIMGSWNGLVDQADHAARACRTALAMAKREAEIQPLLRNYGATNLMTRMGINTGPMVVGDLGTSQKLAVTVLGDSVNLGARLEGANKIYGSQILVAQTTVQQTGDQFVFRELDLLRVKGKLKPMAVYELLAEASEITAELKTRVEWYGEALAHYRARRWAESAGVLAKLLVEFPHDMPATKLIERVGNMSYEDVPADWDGVYVAKDK